MKTYGDIIKRIIEIINYSEDKKRKIPTAEINSNFSKILARDIANEYADEFRNLLEVEIVFYKLITMPNASEKNQKLINLCQERGNIANEQTESYLRLLTILNNAVNKKPDELKEYSGYFILKEELNEFINLCCELGVGPGQRMIEMSPDEVKASMNEFLNSTKNQKKRINDCIQRLTQEAKEPSLIRKENPTYINGKFKELIYLGMSGMLTRDMVIQVKDVLSDSEFNDLLNELSKYGVYDKEQIAEITKSVSSTIRTIKDIDEFIAYMILRDNLNLNALKDVVIQLYGYKNYHYFMDKLFQYGKISYEEYKNSIGDLLSNRERK